jgi:transposase
MACLKVVVGIDVSRDWLDVHILPLRQDLRVANNAAGWRELADRLAQYPNAKVAAEASGGYEKGMLRYLDAAGWDVHHLDAARVRQFARAAGRRAKNDRIDARVIAHYAATFELTPERYEAAVERLAEHVTYRRQLVELRIAVANQARLIRDPRLARLSRSRLRQLDQTIARLDRYLAELIAADPALSAKAAVLRAVKGVGPTLAATLLAYLPELGTVCRRAIAALVGVCPYDFESGKFKGQRHIAGGRMQVRNALYMPTLVAIRHNPGLKAFYERCRENRGKPKDGKEQKKPAVIAAMRKLLTILNAKMRDHLIERHNNPETAKSPA